MENPSSSSQSPTISISSLLCPETEASSFEDDPFLHLSDFYHPTAVAEDDYIRIQLQRETMIGSVTSPPPKVGSLTTAADDWTKQARLEAIDYILLTRAQLGFQYQTAYLSILYFDQFLSKRSVVSGKLWALRLLSVACISLAAKLEEYRVPVLSEFQVGEFSFESKIVQRMELLVLETLEWKMSSVTAFTYLPYFISCFADDQQSPSKGIVLRTIHLILAVAREINLVEHHQSAIASAMVLTAMNQILPRKALEAKINAIPLSRFIDIEDVFTCHNVTKQLEPDDIIKFNLLVSPDLWSSSNKTWTMKSSAASSVSLKRRRLTFDDTDQVFGVPEKRNHH